MVLSDEHLIKLVEARVKLKLASTALGETLQTKNLFENHKEELKAHTELLETKVVFLQKFYKIAENELQRKPKKS